MADRKGTVSKRAEESPPGAVAAPDAPANASDARMPVLDATRLLAAAAIVWLHTVSSARLAPTVDPLTRFAVPFLSPAPCSW